MFSLKFWKDAGERAVIAFAASLLAILTTGNAVGLLDVDWPRAASVAAVAALISLLASVVASRRGDSASASFSAARAESKPCGYCSTK
jgi:hypothetical protein